MDNKSQQIKKTVVKIDINKIFNYSTEYFKSKTLRQIIRYNKRIQDSNNEQEIIKLATRLAYSFDMIVNKTGYVKDKEKKKFWLEISEELFKHTTGVKK
jgi:GTP-binding protein EngB required for normal cell division